MFNRFNILPRFRNEANIAAINGVNEKIIATINAHLQEAVNQTKQVAAQYHADTIPQVCAKIFADLLKIKYVADPADEQNIKLPSALVVLNGDCKSFALYTAAVLCNLGIPNLLRYCSYDTVKIPSHVYNVAILPGGKEYPIDRVFCNKPGTEIPYNFKKDFTMVIRTIRGPEISGLSLKGLVNTVKNAATTVADGVKKVIPDNIENAANKAINTLIDAGKAVSLFIPRKAVLGLIALNVRFLATKLNEMIEKGGEQRLRNTWNSLGGEWVELKGAIDSGKKNKGVFGLRDGGAENQALLLAFQRYGGNLTDLYKQFNKTGYIKTGIAGEPVSTAALIASATPVLIALIAALKQDGISVPEAAELAAKGGEAYASMTGTPINETLFTANQLVQTVTNTPGAPLPISPGGVKPPPAQQQPAGGTGASLGPDVSTTNNYRPGEVYQPGVNPPGYSFGIPNKTLLLGGAAALALIFFLKK